MSSLKDGILQTLNPNEIHLSTLPGREFSYRDPRFLNGADKNMNVLGTLGTPVDFVLGPAPGEIWFVEYITLLLIDPGDMDFNIFGGFVTALTNGFQVLEKVEDDEKIYTTIMDNSDLAQCFFGGNPRLKPSGATDNGFLNEVDIVTGRMEFGANIVLDGNDVDQMIFRVRDDLQAITFLGASAHVKVPRVLPAL